MRHGCCVDGSCDETTCMKLPEDMTCADCTRFEEWCKPVIGKLPGSKSCDYFPRRFVNEAD